MPAFWHRYSPGRMHAIELAQLATLTIFAINALLLAALIVLKVAHRARVQSHDNRRERHVALLSRHIAYANCTDPITSEMAEDPAFLDALIDVRNAVAGPELTILRDIVRRHGVVDHQIRRLRSPFPLGRRLRASVALAEIGDETSAEVLMEHLADREPEIRIQSARGLGRIRWTPAIDQIVQRFSIEIPWVRARFSDTLTLYGPAATWPLIAYVRINHRHENVGPALALRTIAQIADLQAVQPTIEILEQATDLEIEIAAIEALGALASPEAHPHLAARLDSPQWQLRAKSATALGEVGHPASIPLLRDSLRDPNWWVRRNSASALAHVNGGIEALYEALSDDDPYAADAAAEALTDAGELVYARERAGGEGLDPLLAHMSSAAEVD